MNLPRTWQGFGPRERAALLLTPRRHGFHCRAAFPARCQPAPVRDFRAGPGRHRRGSDRPACLRLGPAAKGVLQSALGNLPELFISIFALRAGLVGVVQAALLGSVLANSRLVLGIAFVAGGLKHGLQRLGAMQSRTIAVLTVLSVSALMVPTLTAGPSGPDVAHADALSLKPSRSSDLKMASAPFSSLVVTQAGGCLLRRSELFS
jgi:hypothetical protein